MDDIKRVQNAVEKSDSEFNSSLLSLDDADLGGGFDAECKKSTLSSDDLKLVRERCRNFIKRFLQELVRRLPDNVAVIYKLHAFSPSTFVSYIPKDDAIPWELSVKGCNREEIRSQWQRLAAMRIEEIRGSSNNGEPIDTIEYWIHVSKLTNATGGKMFPELSDFALRALSLPVSNAVVERVFSILSIVKNKLRNGLKLDMLTAILRVRLYNSVRKICCRNFAVTKEMLAVHNSNMYKRKRNYENMIDGADENMTDGADEYIQIYDIEIEEEDEIINEVIGLLGEETTDENICFQ